MLSILPQMFYLHVLMDQVMWCYCLFEIRPILGAGNNMHGLGGKLIKVRKIA